MYTPYPNLKKTGDMVAGQVGFHSNKRVIKVSVEKNNEVIITFTNYSLFSLYIANFTEYLFCYLLFTPNSLLSVVTISILRLFSHK